MKEESSEVLSATCAASTSRRGERTGQEAGFRGGVRGQAVGVAARPGRPLAPQGRPELACTAIQAGCRAGQGGREARGAGHRRHVLTEAAPATAAAPSSHATSRHRRIMTSSQEAEQWMPHRGCTCPLRPSARHAPPTFLLPMMPGGTFSGDHSIITGICSVQARPAQALAKWRRR